MVHAVDIWQSEHLIVQVCDDIECVRVLHENVLVVPDSTVNRPDVTSVGGVEHLCSSGLVKRIVHGVDVHLTDESIERPLKWCGCLTCAYKMMLDCSKNSTSSRCQRAFKHVIQVIIHHTAIILKSNLAPLIDRRGCHSNLVQCSKAKPHAIRAYLKMAVRATCICIAPNA